MDMLKLVQTSLAAALILTIGVAAVLIKNRLRRHYK